ncbi:transposase [Planctomycetota bacterium]
MTYFMVTFTVPDELRDLARSHQKDLYNLMFRASSAALQKLAQDPKYVGGTLGMIGFLQTWTRDLRYHPHIHFLVPGGGLAADGKTWNSTKPDYLMPEKALTAIYRAKVRDGLEQLRLKDKVPVRTWRKPWCVDIEPVGSGKEALKYLTPYIFRVAISNKNILAVDDKTVTFRYRDAKTDRYVLLTLPAEQFIHRFLQHVLPKGFQKVRTYGLYHPKGRRKLKVVKEQLQPQESTTATKEPSNQDKTPKQPVRFFCPCCKVEMIRIGKINRKRGPPT